MVSSIVVQRSWKGVGSWRNDRKTEIVGWGNGERTQKVQVKDTEI